MCPIWGIARVLLCVYFVLLTCTLARHYLQMHSYHATIGKAAARAAVWVYKLYNRRRPSISLSTSL